MASAGNAFEEQPQQAGFQDPRIPLWARGATGLPTQASELKQIIVRSPVLWKLTDQQLLHETGPS
jgi:hypothetical protein